MDSVTNRHEGAATVVTEFEFEHEETWMRVHTLVGNLDHCGLALPAAGLGRGFAVRQLTTNR